LLMYSFLMLLSKKKGDTPTLSPGKQNPPQ
jgi:hypothetical protein